MPTKEIYEKLETIEGGADLIAQIKASVSGLNGESKGYRESVKSLEVKLAEMAEAQKAIIEAVSKGTGVPSADIKADDPLTMRKLAKQIEDMQSSMQSIQQEKAQAQAQALESQKKNELYKLFQKHKVDDSVIEDLSSILGSRYNRDDQGSWIKEDGTLMEKDIELFLSSKKHFIKADVPAGAGVEQPKHGDVAGDKGFLSEWKKAQEQVQ